jgi:hypothetical protein
MKTKIFASWARWRVQNLHDLVMTECAEKLTCDTCVRAEIHTRIGRKHKKKPTLHVTHHPPAS